MTVTAQIIGTAVAVAVAMGAVGLFVLRAVIAADIKPLGDAMLTLTGEVRALTSSIAEERTSRKEERDETRAILRDLEKIVGDHESRLAVLEQPPPPARAAKMRRAS